MVRRSKLRDSGLVPCEDGLVSIYGCEGCEVDDRVLEENSRGGNGRCGYGHGEHGCGKDDRDVNDRDANDRDANAHCVNGLYDLGLHGNDLNGHARHGSAHVHDARGRRLSCQQHSLAIRGC